MPDETWPPLPLEDWKSTYETLHRWTQMVGKVRLNLTPYVNHFWNCALYLTARGLTTSAIPYRGRSFEVRFDFITHNLLIDTSDGEWRHMPLRPTSVASFYAEFMSLLHSLDIDARIWTKPVEIAEPIAFDEDLVHADYDPLAVTRFFKVLSQTDQVLKRFMGGFLGKQSPAHFFWGSFDLAQSRFSGRRAPLPPDADFLRKACYSHEVMSFGFWPGAPGSTDASFYAYAVPEPPGFRDAQLLPEAAGWSEHYSEFLLPYDVLRLAKSPADELFSFFESAYDAGATLGEWNRDELDAIGTYTAPIAGGWEATAEETP